jgi:hypothetical protein
MSRCGGSTELIPSPPAGALFTKELFARPFLPRTRPIWRTVLLVLCACVLLVAPNVLPLNQPSDGLAANATYFWWQQVRPFSLPVLHVLTNVETQVLAWFLLLLFMVPCFAAYSGVEMTGRRSCSTQARPQ